MVDAVDDDPGRAGDAGGGRRVRRLHHGLLLGPGVETRLPGGHVEPDGRPDRLQALQAEGSLVLTALVLEQPVGVLPEVTLGTGAAGGRSRFDALVIARVAAAPALVRGVMDDDPERPGADLVGTQLGLGEAGELAAAWTLEVGVDLEGDRRVGRTHGHPIDRDGRVDRGAGRREVRTDVAAAARAALEEDDPAEQEHPDDHGTEGQESRRGRAGAPALVPRLGGTPLLPCGLTAGASGGLARWRLAGQGRTPVSGGEAAPCYPRLSPKGPHHAC